MRLNSSVECAASPKEQKQIPPNTPKRRPSHETKSCTSYWQVMILPICVLIIIWKQPYFGPCAGQLSFIIKALHVPHPTDFYSCQFCQVYGCFNLDLLLMLNVVSWLTDHAKFWLQVIHLTPCSLLKCINHIFLDVMNKISIEFWKVPSGERVVKGMTEHERWLEQMSWARPPPSF